MAASIRTRPFLLKSLYLPRSSCILCRQCQTTTADVAKSEVGTHDVSPSDIPRGQIDIPKRKKRDSLSILKALASTVGKDPTAPKYQFMDDPKLIPVGRHQQKVALLSKASGKRAARYMVNEFKKSFDHDAAKPHVEAFMPDVTDYQHTDVSMEALEERISRREVKDATEVYNRLIEEGADVSQELKLSLLELLCVFGGKDPGPQLIMEERIIDNLEFPDDGTPSRISMDLADDVFQTLPEKTHNAYNWIVRGLLQGGNSKALIYYNEMKGSKVPVYLGTYNALIDYVRRKKEDKWTDILKYLNDMKTSGVAPNLETFHCVLGAMRSTSEENLKEHVPSVLAEMRGLHIEPTLHTWSLVVLALQPVADESGRQSYKQGYGIMSDIVDIIQHLKTNIDQVETDHSSENFLVRAMFECRKYRDAEAAMMLFELKEELGGRYIITSLLNEHKFYDVLLILISRTQTPDVMMDIYTKVCPSQHVASFECIQELLDNLALYGEFQYVLQLWEDANISLRRMSYDPRLLFKFLEVFANKHVPNKIGEDFVRVAKGILDEKVQSPELQIENGGRLFSCLISTFLNQKHLDFAWKAAMHFLNKELTGSLRRNLINDLFTMCIKEKDVHKIMSFSDLPEDVRRVMINPYIISQNREVLEECLDQTQLEKLEEAFDAVDSLVPASD